MTSSYDNMENSDSVLAGRGDLPTHGDPIGGGGVSV